MGRQSFERQKLRTYRHILSETGEPVTIAVPKSPDDYRLITASITPERRRNDADRMNELNERIEVFVLRDEGDTTYSGINKLVYGTLLKRSSDEDPRPNDPFKFGGEFLEQGLHYYRAIFERAKRVANSRR